MTAFLPIGPLLEQFPNLRPGDIANLVGMQVGHLWRNIHAGQIRWDKADRIAIRLGLHPVLIWGDEWLLPASPEVVERSNRIDVAFAQLRHEVAL